MIEQNKTDAPNQAVSIPKTYEPQAVEEKWYRFWEEGGYFKPQPGAKGKTFVISMPPPNVTGALHLGHAITATVEDIRLTYWASARLCFLLFAPTCTSFCNGI